MDIMKTKPIFKQYLWGGDNIKTMYQKDTPNPPVAESWEISAHCDGLCTIKGGECDGMTIPELCLKFGKDFYGDSMQDGDEFPLLLKILDAKDKLSVQVHPDDEYAFKYEGGSRGKTEAWYILRAEENAQLIYGFKEDITKEEFMLAIENNRLGDVLNYVSCREGDVFYIPSGTVHAVGKGLVIAEIQQSSNTTYRVYDYNRCDKDGNQRELHIDKAIEVSDLKSSKGKEKTVGKVIHIGKTTIKEFVNNEFFHFDEVNVGDVYIGNTNNILHMILIIEGEISIDGVELKMGESVLIPANVAEYKICGSGKLLRYWK